MYNNKVAKSVKNRVFNKKYTSTICVGGFLIWYEISDTYDSKSEIHYLGTNALWPSLMVDFYYIVSVIYNQIKAIPEENLALGPIWIKFLGASPKFGSHKW